MLIFGICGSAAAYRAIDLIRELRKRTEVVCVASRSALRLLRASLLSWASGNEPVIEVSSKLEHIELVEKAKLMLICPATANTIAKIASGVCDTPITLFAASVLGARKPLLIAPAMHSFLYESPFVRESVEKLRKVGVVVIEPRVEEQRAKLAEAERILRAVEEFL